MIKFNKKPGVRLAVGIGLFLSTLDTGIMTVVLKPLTAVFAVTLPVAGLTITFYLFALIASLIPAGWFGERYGSEKMLSAGFVIFAIASLLCAVSPGFLYFVAGRVLQGVGAAFLQANALGYVAKQPQAQRLRLSACVTAAISIGPVLGPFSGGVLFAFGGWLMLFIINIPLCVFAVWLTWRSAATEKRTQTEKIVPVQAVLFVVLVGLAGCLLYLINIQAAMLSILCCCVVMLVIVFVYFRILIKSKGVLLSVSGLLRSPAVFIGSGAFIFGCSAAVFFAAAPVLLLNGLPDRLVVVGLLTASAPAGFGLGALLRRYLAVQINDLHIMRFAAVLMLTGLFALAFVFNSLHVLLFVLAAAVYGIGGGLFQTSNIRCAGFLSPARPAMAGALLRLYQNLGIISGSALALYWLQYAGQQAGGLLETPVWLFAAFTVLGLIALSFFQEIPAYES